MSTETRPAISLRGRFLTLTAACAAILLLATGLLGATVGITANLGPRAFSAFLLIAVIALPGLREHPYDRLGHANWITTFRASLVGLVAALAAEPTSTPVAWAGVVVASGAAILDGWDGWVARRSHMESAFGARFDMEVDALLILLLGVFAWRHGKAGAWVLLSGALRYFFVGAGWMLPWLNRPLPPSVRRKTVCVVQIVGLIVAIGPIIPVGLSALIAAVTLALLVWSFGVDVMWLRRTA